MKPALFFILAFFGASAAVAQVRPASSQFPSGTGYDLFPRTSYKKGTPINGAIFNPFRGSQPQLHPGASGIDAGSAAPALTQGEVAKAIGVKGIQGISLDSRGKGLRIVIGDEIFVPGDEIVFGEGETRQALMANSSVVLKNITQESITLEVSQAGQASFLVVVSLRDFNSQ